MSLGRPASAVDKAIPPCECARTTTCDRGTRESGFGAFVRVARILRSLLEEMVNYTLDQVRHCDVAAVADAQGRVLEDGADADICFKMCQNKISPTSRKKQMKWNRSDWLYLEANPIQRKPHSQKPPLYRLFRNIAQAGVTRHCPRAIIERPGQQKHQNLCTRQHDTRN